MKKILSVFLAVLMLCSAFSVLCLAADKYPAPAAPTNLALSADGIASWDAVAAPAYEEDSAFETTCAIEYRVSLSRWDYDFDDNTWRYVKVADEVTTAETSYDFSGSMVSGKYLFAVTAVAVYSRTKKPTDAEPEGGKTANFKRVGETAEMDKANAVEVTLDIYAEPIDTSVPLEILVRKEDKTGNYILKIVRKIKEVIEIMLRFVGYAGDVSGITEEINNKNNK